MRLYTTLVTGFLCFFPPMIFTNSSASALQNGMVLVPGGIYPMGSHKSLIELNPGDLFNTDRHALGPENPAHNVRVDSYYIDTHEVTHGAYMDFVKANRVRKPLFWDDPDFNNHNQPVVGVSWAEAQSYCNWKGGRLPTEAE